MKVVKTELTEAHKRALAELLGECWHEWTEEMRHNCCRYCSKPISREMLINRTFDNWTDYGRCIEAIKADKELWDSWAWHIEIKWEEVKCNTNCNDIFEWLLDPARCLEIAEFILNRKEKG